MELNPANPIVQLCLQGMAMEEKNEAASAEQIFLHAWGEASSDFEKFLAAYYVARVQVEVANRLKWYETALQHALAANSDSAGSALPSLHDNISRCYAEIGDTENAEKHIATAEACRNRPADKGPFYHGTRADLQLEEFLVVGFNSNYKDDLRMNHIYFTAMPNAAGLAAALAKGEGRERVYIVEPTGSYESDPNVTDKKFPGNPTRSYRTTEPLRVVGELDEWARQTPEQILQWRARLAAGSGDIIN